MARKMGIHYDRVDIPSELSHGDGAVVPVKPLGVTVLNMIQTIYKKPTCVLSDVVEDPYLERMLFN